LGSLDRGRDNRGYDKLRPFGHDERKLLVYPEQIPDARASNPDHRVSRAVGASGFEAGDDQVMKELPQRQKLFVEYYLQNPNATEAAIRAGYSERTARSQGQRLLTNVDIAKAVGSRVEEAAMSADEVLRRLTEHGRASLADVLDDEGQFNLSKAKREGKDHLLKKLKVKEFVTTSQKGNEYKTVTYEYEIHDPQAALVHLGKYHKLFTDKSEINVTGSFEVESVIKPKP
jgi:phage terminase small subunit